MYYGKDVCRGLVCWSVFMLLPLSCFPTFCRFAVPALWYICNVFNYNYVIITYYTHMDNLLKAEWWLVVCSSHIQRSSVCRPGIISECHNITDNTGMLHNNPMNSIVDTCKTCTVLWLWWATIMHVGHNMISLASCVEFLGILNNLVVISIVGAWS